MPAEQKLTKEWSQRGRHTGRVRGVSYLVNGEEQCHQILQDMVLLYFALSNLALYTKQNSN